jgi:hypothetical protein
MGDQPTRSFQIKFSIELTSSELVQEDSPELAAYPPRLLDLVDVSGAWKSLEAGF